MKLYLVKGYYRDDETYDETTYLYGVFSLKDIAVSVKRTLDDHVGPDESIVIEEEDLDKPTKCYYDTVED